VNLGTQKDKKQLYYKEKMSFNAASEGIEDRVASLEEKN
jgi:hypothetical protein